MGVTHVTERPFSCRKYTPGCVDGSNGRGEPPSDVVLEDVDEFGDEAVAAECPIEPSVDEHGCDRFLERAGQADPDVGVLRLPGAVHDAAHDGDSQLLGAGIGSLVNVFGIALVVVGGGFGLAASEFLFRPALEVARREALAPARAELRLAEAELGAEAGLVGAGLLALETLDARR